MHKNKNYNINVKYIGTNDAAIAEVAYLIAIEFCDADGVFEDRRIITTGTARRHPGDKHDEQVAEFLALGRALENLGKKLQKRANGIVKQNDDNEARQARQKAEATKTTAKKSVGRSGRGG